MEDYADNQAYLAEVICKANFYISVFKGADEAVPGEHGI
jgi:hypothetical protein